MKSRFMIVAVIFIFLALPFAAAGADFGLRIAPEFAIPLDNTVKVQDKSVESFTLGGGMNLTADLALFGFFAPFLESNVTYSAGYNTGKGLILGGGGAGLSFFFYPIPRLIARVGAAAGPAAVSYDGSSGLSAYWKAGAELGYRFAPGFSVSAGANYRQYLGSSGSIYKGIAVSLTANLGLGILADRGSGLALEGEQDAQVFPITYYEYAKTPIATITLTNHEQAEIRDLRVTFQAGAFTSAETLCGTVAFLPRGGSAKVPLVAALSDRILAFTENSKVQGELKVTYKILDSSLEQKKAVTLRFNHRNALEWRDNRLLAAFVSPNDPAMLDFSKYVAGLVRERVRPEIDKNLQYGMGMFESLRLYGLVWSADPNTPYRSYHKDASKTDYVQYPYQTLAYKTGDADEIALVIAEAFESIGVPAAVGILADEVVVAFPLAMSPSEAKTAFSAPGDFVYVGDAAWVPLQASLIREGFLRAWQGGSKQWRDAAAAGAAPRLMVLAEAWRDYRSIGLPGIDFQPSRPSEEQFGLAFENVLGRFVAREVAPKAQRLLADMAGGGTGKQRNNLGILYARYGLLPEARAEFEKAVAQKYAPAFVNLANVAFLLKDFETAARWYKAALSSNPSNKAALIGLARAQYELDAYAEADDLFARVRTVDPALADRYAYLSSRVDGASTRASSAAADRGGGMTWAEEE